MIVLGCIAVYFVLGVLYARSQYLRLWQKRRDANAREHPRSSPGFAIRWANDEVRWCIAWRIPVWPVALVFDLTSGSIARWFTAPLTDRRAHAEQLRADAEAWSAKRTSGTVAEREMAAELARICRELADEVAP